MNGIVVGVLRGGPSREHEVSLKTGHAMLSNLPADRFTARDLYIDKSGAWHERGRPVQPDRVLATIDLAMLGLHGEFGEDGEVQRLLERHGVPYTGSDPFGSHLAMHKALAKHRAEAAGILTPAALFAERPDDAHAVAADAIRAFHQPVVVKPVRWGSSLGVTIVGGYQPVLLAIQALFDQGADGVLVEERIRGVEATVGIVEGLRGEALYALPAVEIRPTEHDHFSYESKYGGTAVEVVPGRFSAGEKAELARMARAAHEELGLRHYSRSDFILNPRGIYYLETNTLPGMTAESLFPKALEAIGVRLPDFLSHLADLALAGKKR